MSLLSLASVSIRSEKTKLNLNINQTPIEGRIRWIISAEREQKCFLLLKITSSLLKKVNVNIKTL